MAGIALVYNAEDLERELLAASEDFTHSMQSEPVARLFAKGVNAEIAAAHRAVKDHLASPFSIMIAGDFKRGKSTLINALVGQEVAPVDVQPETMSINRLEHADTFRAFLQSADGGQATLAREDLKRERLEPLLRRLSTPLRHLRIGAPAEMLRRVTLIDTPGLGDVFKEFEPVVREYLAEADTVVYVLSAHSPLSSSEQDFLLSSIAPRHFPKMFFAVNAIDVFATPLEEQRVMQLIRDKLSRIMPGSRVYGMSALDEWSRITGGTRPNPARAVALERSFAEFRRDLEAAIQFRQRYYVVDRAAYAFGKTVDGVRQRVLGLSEALEANREQLDAAVRALEDRQNMNSKEFNEASMALEQGFEKLRREAEGWMSEFVDRIEREFIPKLSTLTAPQIRQHLPFFMRDRLSKAIEACLLSHEPAIAELFEQYTQGMEDQVAALVQAKGRFTKAAITPEQRWSQLQTAQLVAEVLQIGLLIQIGLAIFSRQSQVAKSGQLAEALTKNLPQMREEVRAGVRNAYTSVKEALLQEWSKRHQEELRGQMEDLQQAARLRESGGENVAASQAVLAETHESIAAAKAFLEQFQPKVWSGIEMTEVAGEAV
jgi:hypothetical protein